MEDLSFQNPSFSKKGYCGGFVSSSNRGMSADCYQNRGPGAGTYDMARRTAEQDFYKKKSQHYKNKNTDVSNFNSYSKNLMNSTVRIKSSFVKKVGPGTYDPKLPVNNTNPGSYLKSNAYRLDVNKHPVPLLVIKYYRVNKKKTNL